LTLELADVSEGTTDQELPALVSEGTVVPDALEPDAHSHESNESSSDGGPVQIPATGTGSGQAGPAKGNKKIRLVDAIQGRASAQASAGQYVGTIIGHACSPVCGTRKIIGHKNSPPAYWNRSTSLS